jgi:hypothetical protein
MLSLRSNFGVGVASKAAIIASLAVVPAHADKPSTPVTVENPVSLSPATENSVTVANPTDIAKALGIQHPTAFLLSFPAGSNRFTLPANQRLIIEFVAGSCTIHNAEVDRLDIITELNNDEHIFTVNLPRTVAAAGASTTGNFAYTAKIYADPGSVVALQLALGAGASADIQCFATLSGQLVDVP